MTKMNLKFNDCCLRYTLSDKEAQRLAAAHDSGETLTYADEMGTITLEGGVLTLTGFDRVPGIFASNTPIGVPNTDSEAVIELKTRITEVIVSEGATSLGDEVFRNCPNLTRISIPDTVTYIASPCPQSKKLPPYPLPAKIRSIHNEIYTNYPERIVLPEGLETMWKVFMGTDIKSVYIPGSLKEISLYSFHGCRCLEEVIISEGVEKIESGAFFGCSSLKSVKIPASVKIIRGSAFADCESLTEVEIPEDCSVADSAFLGTPYHRNKNAGRVSTLPVISYDGDTAEIPDLKWAEERLTGLSLPEQAKLLTVHVRSVRASYSYGELDSESKRDSRILLSEDTSTEKLIMLGDIIVGIVIDGEKILLGEDKCTYSASEDDGVGSDYVAYYYGLLIEK